MQKLALLIVVLRNLFGIDIQFKCTKFEDLWAKKVIKEHSKENNFTPASGL